MEETATAKSGAYTVAEEEKAPGCKIKCCAKGPGFWCRKYFWEGQTLEDSHVVALEQLKENDHNLPWYQVAMIKHRKWFGFLLPGIFVHILWWSAMTRLNLFYLFKTKYPMTITMIFGGCIAGMTSEGGGAVAFPVMTLILGIAPGVARDFALMIQGTGMSCASFTIFFMKVRVEWRAIICGGLGGAIGLLVGLHHLDPHLTPAQKKLAFTSIWFSFAFALFLLNRTHKRRTFDSIPDFKTWKGVVLFITGLFGGAFTSFAGNGLDICTFSVITLLFRVSEKIATPTSVVMMAMNSVLGVYWRSIMMGGAYQLAWDYLTVTVEIVAFMSPFGAFLGSHCNRLVLAVCIYSLDTAALIGSYVAVPLTPTLIGMSVGLIVFGFIFFFIVTKIGEKMLERLEQGDMTLEPELGEKVHESRTENGHCNGVNTDDCTRLDVSSTLLNN